MTNVPPFDRDVNTVFQDYALFPHMTVGDNVAYGLMVRKVPKRGARSPASPRRCGWSASTATRQRKPSQLSGGQRQRVALARALVNRPRVLLLDEPLGALDLKLREEMQIELKAIQQQVGITFIYVTHDQEEALTMSDRLAVFNDGRIEQIGAPGRGLRATRRAGSSPASSARRTCSAATVARAGRRDDPARSPSGPRRSPWPSRTPSPADDESSALGTIREVVYLGPDTRYLVTLDAGAELVVTQQNLATTSTEALAQQGKAVRLVWKRQHELPVADGA